MNTGADDIIPVLLCVDVEQDSPAPDPRTPQPWRGFESVYRYFSDLRPLMRSRTGSAANINWFLRMDPQIAVIHGSPQWAASHYSQELEALIEAGDEIGLHPHLHRWVPEDREWLLDFTDQEWIDHCVTTALHAYRDSLGRECKVMRFGFWLNHRTVELMDHAGIEVDLSLVPGQRARRHYEAGVRVVGWFSSHLSI